MISISRLIKIPGKNRFNQLTCKEIAFMIDAFLNGNNDYFDKLAFNDFLHAKLKNESLQQIQGDLIKNAFLKSEGNDWPKINEEYLIKYMKELQHKEYNEGVAH